MCKELQSHCSLKEKEKTRNNKQVIGSLVILVMLPPRPFFQPNYSPRNILQGIKLIFRTSPYKKGNNV